MTDKDNVVTMIRQLNAGEVIDVDGVKIEANQDIPVYHKNRDQRNKIRGDCCKIWREHRHCQL